MFSTQELIELLANNEKRREFIQNYKIWGVWITQPELNLTYYKYDLPNTNGGTLIAMEHLYEPYYGDGEVKTLVTYYLHSGKYFKPTAASESEVTAQLKEIKMRLCKEQKKRDRQCRKCGSKSFKVTQEGETLCLACLAPVI